MRLQSINYDQFPNTSAAWKLSDFALGDVNLLVGVNATGKSRSISVIWSLSQVLRGELKLQDGHFRAVWDDPSGRYEYELKLILGKVESETLIIAGEVVLQRDNSGDGALRGPTGEMLRFKVPVHAVAAVAKRDLYQHPFIEPLRVWAEGARIYRFGTELGKNKLAISSGTAVGEQTDVDPRNVDNTLEVFMLGQRLYQDDFVRRIINDMGEIGYLIRSAKVEPLQRVTVQGLAGPVLGFVVQEDSLLCGTEQLEMSTGMFRAFALLVHLNYSGLSGSSSCLLVDDIGEGLDYERSRSLIKLLMKRAASDHVQIVMTTNDRFVMNAVPLETWSVLVRDGGEVRVINHLNSKASFDTFKMTGLNNFDFFSGQFWNETEVGVGEN